MATPAETYILSYFAALDAAEKGQRAARDQAQDLSLPESEQAAAAAAFLDLTSEIARLKSAHETFMIRFTSLSPPSAETVSRTVALSAALAAEIATSLRAVAILDVVTRFVDAWAQLSQAPSAVPVAGAATADSKPKRIRTPKPPKVSAWLAAHVMASGD